jgi:hypothetical protein
VIENQISRSRLICSFAISVGTIGRPLKSENEKNNDLHQKNEKLSVEKNE